MLESCKEEAQTQRSKDKQNTEINGQLRQTNSKITKEKLDRFEWEDW